MKIKLVESEIPKLNVKKSDVDYVDVYYSTDLDEIPDDIKKFNNYYYWTSDDSYKDPYAELFWATVCTSHRPFITTELADEICDVRPFINIRVSDTQNISNFKKGDIVNCFGYDWYYVSRWKASFGPDMVSLFCMGSIGKCRFSSKQSTCKYEDSELHKFVQDWWKSVKDEQTNNEHFEAKIYKGKHLIDTLYSNDFKDITDMIDEELAEGHWVEFTNKLNGKSMALKP